MNKFRCFWQFERHLFFKHSSNIQTTKASLQKLLIKICWSNVGQNEAVGQNETLGEKTNFRLNNI